MSRYFDKRELVLILLVILLFDINGYCTTVIPHIIYKNKQTWLVFIMINLVILIDIYIYHSEVNSVELHNIEFVNNKLRYDDTCENKIKYAKEEITKQYNELLNNNCTKKENIYYKTLEKVVLTILACLFICLFIGATYISETNTVDSKEWRIIRGSPLLLLSVGILYFVYS